MDSEIDTDSCTTYMIFLVPVKIKLWVYWAYLSLQSKTTEKSLLFPFQYMELLSPMVRNTVSHFPRIGAHVLSPGIHKKAVSGMLTHKSDKSKPVTRVRYLQVSSGFLCFNLQFTYSEVHKPSVYNLMGSDRCVHPCNHKKTEHPTTSKTPSNTSQSPRSKRFWLLSPRISYLSRNFKQ